jgi:chorismate lyase / 3-hydroxybenzoate synthase
MALEGSLQVDYLPLAGQSSARCEDVLGVAAFDAGNLQASASTRAPGDIPFAAIRMPVLGCWPPASGASGEVCEIWRTRQPLESGQRSRLKYRRSEQLLFGCISLPESAGLQAATTQAYREIFTTLNELGYSHLLRIWNYLPQINADMDGSERYWQFNTARRNALLASGRDTAGNVPAACALGSVNDSPLVVYFLASRIAPSLIENPRQISAYEYPPQYGPKPAFSRASLLRQTSGAILFISGTASIVGHQTMHTGDVAAQTRETLVNIEALLGAAKSTGSRFRLETLAYKVYVRNSADLPLIQSQLRGALGPGAAVIYLQADIYRRDLLVEVEAMGREHNCA